MRYILWAIYSGGKREAVFSSTELRDVQVVYHAILHGKFLGKVFITEYRDPLTHKGPVAWTITKREIEGVRPSKIPGRIGKYKQDKRV